MPAPCSLLPAPCSLFLILASPGCGGGGGGDDGGTGTTDGDSSESGEDTENVPTGDQIPPDPIDGDDCDPPTPVLGFNTRCFQDKAFIRIGSGSNEDDATEFSDLIGAGDGSSFTGPCCEGFASEATADEACAIVCQEQLCEVARQNHLDMTMDGQLHICQSEDCGFDLNACLTGEWHEQTLDYVIDEHYFLRAQCENPHTDELFTGGLFDWHDSIDNNPGNNPGMCEFGKDPLPTPISDPDLIVSDHSAIGGEGMTATVSWTIGSSSDAEASSDVGLAFAYDKRSCGFLWDCLALAELELSLPPMTVQGFHLENAHLKIFQVDAAPVVHHDGSFVFPAGTLHAIMSAVVDGEYVVLRGTNSVETCGVLSPQTDEIWLSGLTFDYCDSVISAQLDVEISGTYVEHGPRAAIDVVKAPLLCSKPVRFRAASTDLDSSTLSHRWWVPNKYVGSGTTTDVVLPLGSHSIRLFSQDPEGNLDTAAISYTRICL
jgi:hypothetical protein